MTKLEVGALVLVYWNDAVEGTIGWHDLEDFKIPSYKCRSVGWIIKETDEVIALVADSGIQTEESSDEKEEQIGRRIFIPKGMQTKVIYLSEEPARDALTPLNIPLRGDTTTTNLGDNGAVRDVVISQDL